MSTPRRPRTRSSAAASPVTVRRPDPRAWREALKLAGGDARRLSVTDDGTVLVRNTP